MHAHPVREIRVAAGLATILSLLACSDGGTPPDDGGRDAMLAADATGMDAPRADAQRADVPAADAPAGDAPSTARGCPSPLPTGWLFCDDFESGDLSRWTETPDDPARLRVSNDAANARSGTHAMYVPAEASTGYQGGEATWRPWPVGYQEMHVRFWVKFAADFESLHHFVHMGAARMDDRYSADGLAGCRPTGSNFFSNTLDLTRYDAAPAPGRALLYTYWPEMTCEPGSVCSRYADVDAICAGCASRGAPCSMGPECCWGNFIEPAERVVPPRDAWVCMEFATHLNDVGGSDGWIAYSVGGIERARRTGMRIRTDEVLQLNSVRAGIYNTSEDAMGHSNRAWLDDVVVSTGPVGCE